MASPQSAYRSSPELKSAKYAPPQPSPLARRILASRLPGNLRLTFMSLVSASQQGPDFWASTFAISVEAGGKEGRHSYRTVQRHIDQLERLRVLKKKHEANSYVDGFGMRRTATYVLHPEADKRLTPREGYSEWRARHRRSAPPRIRPQSTVQQVEVAAPPAAPHPPAASAAPAPVPSPERDACRSPRKFRELSARDGRELVRYMAQLKKGVSEVVAPEGFAYAVGPGDARYRAPMSASNALTAACMKLGLNYEPARAYAEKCGFKFDDEESGSGP